MYKNHHASLDEFMTAKELENIRVQQLFYLKGVTEKPRSMREMKQPKADNAKYLISKNTKFTKDNERLKRSTNPCMQSLPTETTPTSSMRSSRGRSLRSSRLWI